MKEEVYIKKMLGRRR